MSEEKQPMQHVLSHVSIAPKNGNYRSEYDIAANMAELNEIISGGVTRDTTGWVSGIPGNLTPAQISMRSTQARIKHMGVFPACVPFCVASDDFNATRWSQVPKSFLEAPGGHHKGLLVTGVSRAGKTMLAANVFWNRFKDDAAASVFCFSARMYEAMYSNRVERDRSFTRAMSTGVLLLDDVGQEDSTSFANGVTHLIGTRYEQNRETWITTGLTSEQLEKRYGPQIRNRIVDGKKLVRLEPKP